MLLRQATLADIPALMSLVRRVVPLMRAAGNLQWDDHYPNEHIFERDIDHEEGEQQDAGDHGQGERPLLGEVTGRRR